MSVGKYISTMDEGEFTLPQELVPFSEIADVGGPIAVLKSGLGELSRSLKRTLGDKKRLIVVIALVVIWLVVNLLAALNIFPLPVHFLSWLTAAQGSLIGGSIGKGLVAALFAQIITDKTMLKSVKTGIGQMKSLAKGGKQSYAPVLFGAGAALIICNMMVSSNIQNAMVAITSFLLSAKALIQNGFLRRLIQAFIPKAQNTMITMLMRGGTLGFALFAVISFLPGVRNGYIFGMMLLLAALILKFISGQSSEKNKEVGAQ